MGIILGIGNLDEKYEKIPPIYPVSPLPPIPPTEDGDVQADDKGTNRIVSQSSSGDTYQHAANFTTGLYHKSGDT
jgi:hypothetical protein